MATSEIQDKRAIVLPLSYGLHTAIQLSILYKMDEDLHCKYLSSFLKPAFVMAIKESSLCLNSLSASS